VDYKSMLTVETFKVEKILTYSDSKTECFAHIWGFFIIQIFTHCI